MHLGVALPQVGRVAGPGTLKELASAAEALGFHSAWVGDHVFLPAALDSIYPYSGSGEIPMPTDTPFLECFSTLAYAAAATTTLRLGTDVCVLPYRTAPLLAKVTATVDFLAEGRLILGVGLGWCREEFGALGVGFDSRGRLADEWIDFLRKAWGPQPASFKGEFVSVEPAFFVPRPAGDRQIPIWVGGNSRLARSRAAKRGDAWLPVVGADMPPKRIAECFAEVRSIAAAAGRGGCAVGLAASLAVRTDLLQAPGSAHWARFEEQIDGLAAAGVEHLIVLFGGSVRKQLTLMESIATEVIPRVRS